MKAQQNERANEKSFDASNIYKLYQTYCIFDQKRWVKLHCRGVARSSLHTSNKILNELIHIELCVARGIPYDSANPWKSIVETDLIQYSLDFLSHSATTGYSLQLVFAGFRVVR
jgi:hypothetical protein